MTEFMNMLLEGVGLPSLLTLPEITDVIQGAQGFYNLARPDLIFSVFFYVACSLGVFGLTLKLLYRVVKKMIRYPSRKGCEK